MKAIILFIVPFISFTQMLGQVVPTNAYLPPQIEIGPLPVLHTSAGKLSIRFVAWGSQAFIELSGAVWGAATVSLGNEAIFLFSNDMTVTVKSMEVQGLDAGNNTYKHRYAINRSDVETLSQYNLIGIRKYSFRDFSDLAIPRQKAGPIKELSAAFLKELSKLSTAKAVRL
jgi:hypothetical protein